MQRIQQPQSCMTWLLLRSNFALSLHLQSNWLASPSSTPGAMRRRSNHWRLSLQLFKPTVIVSQMRLLKPTINVSRMMPAPPMNMKCSTSQWTIPMVMIMRGYQKLGFAPPRTSTGFSSLKKLEDLGCFGKVKTGVPHISPISFYQGIAAPPSARTAKGKHQAAPMPILDESPNVLHQPSLPLYTYGDALFDRPGGWP